MQAETYADGTVKQEIFTAESEEELESLLRKKHAIALKNGAVSITQHKCGRNDPCPCGSGRKFKCCCVRFNNRGKRTVTHAH